MITVLRKRFYGAKQNQIKEGIVKFCSNSSLSLQEVYKMISIGSVLYCDPEINTVNNQNLYQFNGFAN